MVERHRDVGAQVRLDLHRAFGGKKLGRAVQMGAEPDSFLRDLHQLLQAHHLVSAAVGEDGAVPGHEPVQPAEIADQPRARTEHQVVRVREQDARAGGFQVAGREPLHRTLRSDGHEGGRGNVTVRRRERARARARRPAPRCDRERAQGVVRDRACSRLRPVSGRPESCATRKTTPSGFAMPSLASRSRTHAPPCGGSDPSRR